MLISYSEKILIRRWSYDTWPLSFSVATAKDQDHIIKNGRSNPPQRPGSAWDRLRFGAYIAFSDRYIASPHQAPNTPPYSSCNLTHIPSRATFVARKLGILLVCYLITDLTTRGNQPALNPILYADSKIPFFSRLCHGEIGGEELATRVITSLGFWFGGYFIIQGYSGFWQLLSIASGMYGPELERPIFGSFGEAYTIRGFWGSFWHQLIRCRLVAMADWVTYDILRLPRSGGREKDGGSRGGVDITRIVARYTHILCCFFVSGVFHQFIDAAQGLRWGESGATQSFVLMAVGIMIEDAVQWVWFDVLGGAKSVHPKRREGTWWTMCIGYVWVALWLSVATPWYGYPTLSRNEGARRDAVVPFSVVGFFLARWKF